MKYQTNKPLGRFINAWGCNMCCIMEKVEVCSARNGHPFKFTNEDVVRMYQEGMKRGHISKEIRTEDGEPFDGCIVNNGPAFFNLCAATYKLPVECTGMEMESKAFRPTGNEEEILELRRPGHPGSHFVAGNGKVGVALKDEIEFDPIEGGSKSARDGYIFSKRIYTVVRKER